MPPAQQAALSVFATIFLLNGYYADIFNRYYAADISFNVINTISEETAFHTTIISSLKDCVEECRAVTSCKLVNYRRRGHICELVHYMGSRDFGPEMVHSENGTAGIVSLTKPFPYQNDTTESVCLSESCESSQSCKRVNETGICEKYACGKPPYYGRMVILGNVYTVNSKLVYRCLNHASYRYYYPTIKCDSENGKWTEVHDICWYNTWPDIIGSNPNPQSSAQISGIHVLNEQTHFLYKVVNIEENKTDAERKCRSEGARLISVLKEEKKKFFYFIWGQIKGEKIKVERLFNELWSFDKNLVLPNFHEFPDDNLSTFIESYINKECRWLSAKQL